MAKRTIKNEVKAEESERWKQFGLWIKDKREYHRPKLTQKDLAALCDLDRQTIYRIEHGTPTKRENVLSLAKALNANEAEALRLSGFDQATITHDSDLIALTKNLTVLKYPDHLRELKAVIAMARRQSDQMKAEEEMRRQRSIEDESQEVRDYPEQ